MTFAFTCQISCDIQVKNGGIRADSYNYILQCLTIL